MRLGPLHNLRVRLLEDVREAALGVEYLKSALTATRALLPYNQLVYPKARIARSSSCD